MTAWLVELAGAAEGAEEVPNYTAFASAGRVRPILATQLLRAAEVGGLLDARLELNTYHLLGLLGEPLGPWIGAELELREQGPVVGLLAAADVPAVLSPPPRAVFAPCASRAPRFLEVGRVDATEVDARGSELGSGQFEYVLPRASSSNTLLALPLVRSQGEVFVGLELRDLPSVQAFTGRSRFATCPAWRLPRTITNLELAEAWLSEQLRWQFGARRLRAWPLGGKYYPASGVAPEVVYPLAVEMDGQSVRDTALSFLPLREVMQQRQLIEDGHLLIALWRAAHAVGVLGS